MLPPRGRGGRQGHARDLPGAPVRQGRDVLLRRPREGEAEHERLLAIEESILQELEIPYRVVAIAVNDLGASARRSTTARPGCRAGALPRADLELEHDRLPVPAAGHPLPAPEGRPTTSTRSTARLSRSVARSSRCWRTASRTTARCAARGAGPLGVLRRCRRPDSVTARSGRRHRILEDHKRRPRRAAGPIRARIRTPNVFQGRTVTIADSRGRPRRRRSPPQIPSAFAPRRPPQRAARHRAVDRLGLGEPEEHLRAARHGLHQEAVVDHEERVVGARGGLRCVSSNSPSPQEAHTRADGAGGSWKGDGAAMTAEPRPFNFGRGKLRSLYEPQCRTG